ncbi:MAG: putative drug exporter of the superfamily [Solirubrobacteraceae bacterium]|nr:putative drug exporter of the superfamily [Solirubrobacteraceae bacterium]
MGTAREDSGFGPRRLALYATRHPRRILRIWGALVVLSIVVFVALINGAVTADQKLTNNPESYVAKHLIAARLPNPDKVDEVVVVRSEQRTVTDPAFAARIDSLTATARATGAVRRLRTYRDPGGAELISADRHATIVPIVLAADKHMRIGDLVPAIQRADGAGGFAVHITGEHTLGRDFGKVSESDLRTGELQFGLPAALIVLLLVFGTVVGAMIPMLMAVMSILVALGVIAVIGQLFQVNLFITNMVVAMGLALGIDYSLFIVSRLREERRRGRGTQDAILAVANTATRAVVFSGVAFTLAMIGMLLVPDTTLRSLGLGAVVVALVSLAVALTFHPAMLMVLGDRVDRLRLPWIGARIAATAGAEGPLWRRAILAVMRRPAAYLVATVAILVALASPILGLKLGSSGSEALPDSAVGKQGVIALQRDFPSGATDPVNVVVDASPAAAAPGLARLRSRLARDRDFATGALSTRSGPRIAVASLPLTVEPNTERASAAIDRLRDRYVPQAFGAAASRVSVGGGAAEARDSYAIDSRWLPIVVAFVLTLSVVLLTLAFRSIAIPLTAVAMNLLSVGAAYGILVLVFQHGLGKDVLGFGQVARIEAWVPIFLFSVLFGLSMDYQVFLLSRIRERWSQTGDTNEAIVHGVASTARLITGAAAIIIVVFSGFATGQLVAFQQMGFGIAVALALDATLVRLLLIPSTMRLLGDRNWVLPQWLRWLPNLQVEGTAPDTAPSAPVSPAITAMKLTVGESGSPEEVTSRRRER